MLAVSWVMLFEDFALALSVLRVCGPLRALAWELVGDLQRDFRAASPSVLSNLVRTLMSNNRTVWGWRRRPASPRNCFEALPQNLSRMLAGWFFTLEPDWGTPEAERHADADLFHYVGKVFRNTDTEFTHSFNVVAQVIMKQAGVRALNTQLRGLNKAMLDEGGLWRPCAINPFDEAGGACIPHHAAFLSFLPVGRLAEKASGEPMVDFLGVHQHRGLYEDVRDIGYHLFPPTRVAAWKDFADGTVAETPLPFVDEEYFQHIDVLASALDTWQSGATSFTVAELGASRLGLWAARAVAAWLKLRPHGHCQAAFAEILPDQAEELRNSITQLGLGGCSSQVWTVDVQKVGLPELLGSLGNSIDHLDMDIEGAELPAVMEARAFLKERVRRIHIGTHSRHIHYSLEKALRQDGWHIIWSFPNHAFVQTPYGRVAFLNGVLAAVSRDGRWRGHNA